MWYSYFINLKGESWKSKYYETKKEAEDKLEMFIADGYLEGEAESGVIYIKNLYNLKAGR